MLGAQGPAFQDVNPETSKRIGEFVDDSAKSSDELASEFSRGTENTPSFMAGVGGFQGQRGSGVDSQALMDAIERRASRKAGAQNTLMKSEIQTQAIESRFRRLQEAAKLANAELQHNEKAKMNRYLARQNRKRARASVLGNVLGIGGAIGGAFAGGPAGAAAGFQIGQGAGQMTGT